MNYAGLVVLVVATVAGICSCQSCTLPTNEDLEDVIEEILRDDDSSGTPTVNVMRFHQVCLAFDDVQSRYRAVSVLVEYTCSGRTICPSGTAVEQIESECGNYGEWSNLVQGSPEFTRSPTPEASFSTSTRQDCAFCVSPELDVGADLRFSPDSVTHCVACHSNCSEGLMGCTGFGPDRCCNFYNNSMCVDECLSPFQPNTTTNECVCPPGTTGFNCSLPDVDCGDLTEPDNGAVSVSGTTYNSVATYSCDSGYVLMGDGMRRCLDTGDWSGNASTCVVYCDSLGNNVTNGAVQYSTERSEEGQYIFNTTITVKCNNGYGPGGVITCQHQPTSVCECSSSALIGVSIVSFLLIVTLTIIIITQCLLMARMRKSKDVHRNETYTEVTNPTTMQSYIPVTPNEAYVLQSVVPVTPNEAYVLQNDVPVTANEAYVLQSDVPVTPNEAYGLNKMASAREEVTYELVK